jgi:SAM-dependent methyltransferase
MYEAYPYPSPITDQGVIEDIANCLYSLYGDSCLAGMRILDAGCGTGHRLVGTALRYPQAEFVGVDMTEASLEVAAALARKNGVKNVRLERVNLLDGSIPGQFDIVISSGVIHHLEDPQQGLKNLASLLSPKGLLIVWLYHSLGEHERLLDRELLLEMWNRAEGLERGLQTIRALGLQLEVQRYGSTAMHKRGGASRDSIDVDAYLHPIVNAYRFDEVLQMLRACRNLSWAAINNINLCGSSKLLDLAQADQSETRYLCLTAADLFEDVSLLNRFRELGPLGQLRVLELETRPNGFTVVAGCGDSYGALSNRLAGNVLALAARA